MPSIDLVRRTEVDSSGRVRQLSAMFDVPLADVSTVEWHGELPIDGDDWQVGLIVGPSGSGKTTIARDVFGDPWAPTWGNPAVVDDFAGDISMDDIARICQSVGFNTIPAWMRPYGVLSTGEQFRVTMARYMLEAPDPIVMDEFTSVVDRQVAKIGAHAVQKWVRRNGRKFVAVTCHYDVLDWLQPDWVFEPATMSFQRRSVQPRPAVDVEIARVPYSAWEMFAPFHYLTRELHRAAACFVLFANGQPAAFGGMLHRPHPHVNDIMGLSRLVTLPDWQGLGLAMLLSDTLGAAYKAVGKRMHTYPAHPALIRSFDKSPMWAMTQAPGNTSIGARTGSLRTGAGRDVPRVHKFRNADGTRTSAQGAGAKRGRSATTALPVTPSSRWKVGSRPCAVFEYAGPAMDDVAHARGLLEKA